MATEDIFKEFVASAAEKFKSFDRRKTIRVISHLDTDGISAVAIFVKALTYLKFKYSISFVQSLDKETILDLSNEHYSYFVFLDLGSGQLKEIVSKFKEKEVFILDHHVAQSASLKDNIIHINPVLFGIDGGNDISAAGVSYLFSKNLDKKVKNMVHLAIVGAIGDQQNDFTGLNREILDEAIELKKIKVDKGIRFFGRQSRPLNKLLEYSTDPYIPGVSGSSLGTQKFLDSLGIKYKRGEKARRIIDLSEDEMKILIKGIIKKRKYEKKPKDIFGNIYSLVNEEPGTSFKDAKEYSTLLNACGRLGKASLGVGVCLKSKSSREKAKELLKNYKKEILEIIRWYERNKKSEDIHREEGYLIINGRGNIMPSLAGTFASILSYSSETKDVKFIMVMAQNVDSTTKISLRYAGRKLGDVDLSKVLKEISKRTKCETGGHKSAAGAMISTELEDEFIKVAKEIFSSVNLEEKV